MYGMDRVLMTNVQAKEEFHWISKYLSIQVIIKAKYIVKSIQICI